MLPGFCSLPTVFLTHDIFTGKTVFTHSALISMSRIHFLRKFDEFRGNWEVLKNMFKVFPQTESLRKQPIPSCDVLLRSVSPSHFLSLIKVLFNLRLLCQPISLFLSFFLSLMHCMTAWMIVSNQCPKCECLSPFHFSTFLIKMLH